VISGSTRGRLDAHRRGNASHDHCCHATVPQLVGQACARESADSLLHHGDIAGLRLHLRDEPAAGRLFGDARPIHADQHHCSARSAKRRHQAACPGHYVGALVGTHVQLDDTWHQVHNDQRSAAGEERLGKG
jgi:hypothetical protein